MNYTKREILEESNVIRQCDVDNSKILSEIAKAVNKNQINHIITSGRGTSKNAAHCFKFFSEILCNIKVSHANPCISTVYNAKINFEKTMFIAISQSGMSIDTLKLLQAAKSNGAITVLITNNKKSNFSKYADYSVYLNAGSEKSVMATKSFMATLYTLLKLAEAISNKDVITTTIADKLDSCLPRYLDLTNQVSFLADSPNVLVLSRGLMQSIADEFALRLMTATYKFPYSVSTAEFYHGAIALIEKGTPVIMLAPDGECSDELILVAKKVKSMGAKLIAFSDINTILNIADVEISMPKCSTWEAPFVYGQACQLFSMELSLLLNVNPDKPRNLTKITITT